MRVLYKTNRMLNERDAETGLAMLAAMRRYNAHKDAQDAGAVLRKPEPVMVDVTAEVMATI